MAYVIYRIQKLAAGSRGAGTLGQCLQHLRKHTVSAEISKPQKSKDNLLKGCTDYKAAMHFINECKKKHNETHKRGFRSDAAVACEMVFSYSPEEPTGQKNRKGEDIMQPFGQSLEYALEYEKRMLAFIREQFPKMRIATIARHMDEGSIHWHIVGVCFDDKTSTLSVRQMVGGPADLKKQQSRLAELCADIGLKRGIPKEITKSKHQTKREHNRLELAAHAQRIERAEQEAEQALADIGLSDFDR